MNSNDADNEQSNIIAPEQPPVVQTSQQPTFSEPLTLVSTVQQSTSSPSMVPKTKKSKKKIIILIIVLTVAVLVGGILLFTQSKDSNPSSSKVTDPSNPTVSADDIVVNGNTYYAEPKEIKDLTIFKDELCTEEGEYCKNGRSTSTAAYQIGKTKDNKEIIGYRPSLGPGTSDIILVKNNATYEIVYADGYIKDGVKDSTLLDVSASSSTTLSELNGDVNPTIKGQKLEGDGVPQLAFLQYGENGAENKPAKTGHTLATQNNKTYYSINEDKGTYFSKTIVARFGKTIDYNYKLSGEINATNSKAAEKITWTKGDATKDTYRTGGGGCGSANNYSAAKAKKTDLIIVGKTPGGQTVYQLPNTDPLVKEIYENDYKNGESTIDNATYKNLTVDEFSNKHAYFIIENNFGDFVVMLSDSFFAQGGCGKPVIYLYPQKDTLVNVSVGADVVISEPQYPNGGWKNVLAQPNGDLTYSGKKYGSLYWEGYGHGAYPDITSGTIVASKDAPQTIRNQLKSQGLQGREIEEFMAFWQPKLPTSPYVRLTWFNNSQLNVLAPLSITPRPNTVIRTFLDFEGLDKPVSLKTQKFLAPQRKGFTVVEWGGLLRGGL